MPYPIPFYMRVGASNALTHAELDSNQQILSDKIDLTVGNNLGNGAGIYLSKTANANDGFLNFRTMAGLSGTSIFISGDTLVFVNDGDFCHTPVKASEIEACDCTSGVTINTNCDGCGDVNFGVSGVTFNYNSTSSYTFPCFDGAVNYVLCTDGYGNVDWCPPQSGGTASADTFISNFQLVDETNLQIFRSDGVSWNVDISGVTPYHYGEGYRAIEPRVVSQHHSYARGELSNIQGGYYNIVDLDSNFSFIGGGLNNDLSGSSYSLIVGGEENDIIAYVASGLTFSGNTLVGGRFNRLHGVGSSFIGGGLQNKIQRAFELTGATPVSSLIVGGEYNIITGETQGVSVIVGGKDNVVGYGVTGNFIGGGYENTIEHMYGGYGSIVGGYRNVISGDTYSSIVGGQENRIDGDNTTNEQSLNNFIGGGKVNQLDNTVGAAIVGGFHNFIKADAGSVDGEGTEKYREYSFIGAGEHNQIQGGTDNVIVGGHRNIIQSGTSWSSIVGGSGNTINHYSNYSFIGGGTGNTINHRYGFIGAGQDNTIHTLSHLTTSNDSFQAAIVAGRLNQVRSKQSIIGAGYGNIIEVDSVRSAIISGRLNVIYSASPNSLIGVGVQNAIYENNNAAVIVGGIENEIYGGNFGLGTQFGNNSKYSFIGGGFSNAISGFSSTIVAGMNSHIFSAQGFVGAGINNVIHPASKASSIVGGQNNVIYGSIYTALTNVETYAITVMSATSAYSFIGGGYANIISGYTNTIAGGIANQINENANTSFIGGGSTNIINGPADRVSIVGGLENKILNARLSAIVNASGNTIYSHAEDAAIIGGSSLIATSASTTFMHGLDVDTGTRHGDRPFKYHGSFTNSNINFVLTSIDNDGTAVWKPAPGTTSASTRDCSGDEYVVSATTSGCCQLVLTTNSGTTIIQDICNDLGPYQWGESPNSIRPVLPSAPGDINFFDTVSDLSGIMAGRANTISGSPYSFIGGGSKNMIDISPPDNYGWNAIVNGSHNKIQNLDGDNQGFSSLIVNGDKNIISGGTRNSILNGLSNRVGADYATVLNGAYNISNHRASTIVGGLNIMSLTSHTVYMNGLSVNTTLTDPLIGGERYFQYHGAAANPGQNKFLMDVDGMGNAVWSDIPGRPTFTGDTFAVSAYTSGCTLYITVSDGTTLTADTCNSFSDSPYRYDNLVDNIVPKLPNAVGLVNQAGDGIQWTTYNNIAGGQRNKILTFWDTTANSIINGFQNVISGQTSYAGVGGYKNVVGTQSSNSHVFGSQNILQDASESLVGGWKNYINSSDRSFIGAGTNGEIWRSNASAIVAGKGNIISADTQTPLRSKIILGGSSNKIISQGSAGDRSDYALIGNGLENRIWRGSTRGFIGNGNVNYISGVTYATIINGKENRIFPNIKEGGVPNAPDYSVIVNGTGNTISYEYNAAAIIGGVNISAQRSQTTHMKGLYVDTDTTEGQRAFRYYGSYAAPGMGRVLTDISGSGDAVWQEMGGPRLTGDTFAVSAYTSGCTLYINVSDGTILTANTCNEFGSISPYEYSTGIDSIRPVIPTQGSGIGNDNEQGFYHNIAGGHSNKILFGTGLPPNIEQKIFNNAIINGKYNTISGNTNDSWLSGSYNLMIDSYVSAGGGNLSYLENVTASNIQGGWKNSMVKSVYSNIDGGHINKIGNGWNSSIQNGTDAVLSGDSRTVGIQYGLIGNGLDNHIYSHYQNDTTSHSTILNGNDNRIWHGSGYGTILNGAINYITGTTYAHILGGRENRILPGSLTDFPDGVPQYGAIVNGSGNTIMGEFKASAIIGGVDIDVTRSQTTFMKGLDVNTDTTEGLRQFRYRGGYANPGLGSFLMDSTGSGDAVWTRLPIIGYTGGTMTTGDTFVVSAFTSGCTLFITLTDGTVYDADICDGFTDSPYRYDAVNENIVPKSPSSAGVVNQAGHNGIITHYNNIAGGWKNKIWTNWDTFGNAIVNGEQNIISGQTSYATAGGYRNIIEGASTSSIAHGGYNYVRNSAYGNVFGYFNTLWNTTRSAILGGNSHTIIKGWGNVIGGGIGNVISGRTSTSNTSIGIASGYDNLIVDGNYGTGTGTYETQFTSVYSFIGGGIRNNIWQGSVSSVILGGGYNYISGTTNAAILSGRHNKIHPGTKEGPMFAPDYSAIVNGSGNTISWEYNGAAIIGGVNITALKSQTTHMKGLYVDTDTTEGQRAFRYYGSYASPGPGRVLTDISGSGDAVWQEMGGPRLTGDTFAVSAFTSGCTLYINVSDGTVLTANTCNEFGSISPYEYSTAANSIRPVIPSQGSGIGNDNVHGDYHNIAGGYSNKILYGSNIGNTPIPRTFNDAVINGMFNTISGNTNNSVIGGLNNLIVGGSSMGAGEQASTHSVYLFGTGGYIQNSSNTTLAGGQSSSIIDSTHTFMGGGLFNKIRWSRWSSLVGGRENYISGASYSFIGGGNLNQIEANQGQIGENMYAIIGGGNKNVIKSFGADNRSSGIVSGEENEIWNGSVRSFIGGGLENKISGVTESSIVGGYQNTITQGFREFMEVPHYSGILNGSGNTISHNHVGSAILGGVDIQSQQSQTTHMKGLYIDTDTTQGARSMRYFGTFANAGLGRVLKDMSGVGDAVWQDAPSVDLTGDTYAISAFTQGCILTVLVSDGTTLTADTCNEFTAGPYRYDSGFGTIVPKLPPDGTGWENDIKNGLYNNVGGGIQNIITGIETTFDPNNLNFPNESHYNTIGGGVNNIISGITVTSSIGYGWDNKMISNTYSSLGGYNNRMEFNFNSNILGGATHLVKNTYQGTILNGIQHINVFNRFGTIINGNTNAVSGNTAAPSTGGQYGLVGNGQYNRVLHSGIGINKNYFGTALNGSRNVVWDTVTYGHIGNGFSNQLSGTSYGSIHNGLHNFITGHDQGGEGSTIREVKFPTILNGSGNTISAWADGSVIQGGFDLHATVSQTTYMKGLDVETDTTQGQRKFRYHGTWANEGAGRFLKSTDNLGNAVWADLGNPSVELTGDTYAISAFTSGCTLYITVSNGVTLTADTCGSFNEGPYEYGTAHESIRPKLPPQSSFWKNRVLQGQNHNIAGGRKNLIVYSIDDEFTSNKITSNGIVNGDMNTISGASYYSAMGGNNNYMNTVIEVGEEGSMGQNSASWMFGYSNYLENSKYTSIAGGSTNSVQSSDKTFIGAGQENKIITKSHDAAIVGGHANTIISSRRSFIGAGTNNLISGATTGALENFIGAGHDNRIISGYANEINLHSSVVGGRLNTLWKGSGHGFIGGGLENYISGVTFGSILGGEENRIFPGGKEPGSEQTPNYSAILNGSGNTISGNVKGAAIIGGVDITAQRSQTTHMKGLYVDTNTTEGERAFRYYGTFANPGTGKVLTSLNSLGDAYWADPNSVQMTGDTFAVSAFTNGCILNVLLSDGVTLTADTCNEFTDSPYRYDLGNGNIIPKLPVNPSSAGYNIAGGTGGAYNNIGGGQFNGISGYTSVIGGGMKNKIGDVGYGFIGGGSDNSISDSLAYTTIVGGFKNEIVKGTANWFTFIGGGRDNRITGNVTGSGGGSQHSSIVGGEKNLISGITSNEKWSLIGGGENNTIVNGIKGVIVNGWDNSISPASGLITNHSYQSSILNGRGNLILADTASHYYGHILGGSGHTTHAIAHSSAILGGVDMTAFTPSTTYLGSAQAHGRVRIASKEYMKTSHANYTTPYQTPVSTLDIVHDNITFAVMSAGTAGGEIVRFGSIGENYLPGMLVQLRNGSWYGADADATSFQGSMLGIALGSNPNVHGVLIRGFAALNSNADNITTWTVGSPVYVSSTTGAITETAPSSTNQFVRVVGYMAETTNLIYFNPDGTFIKIA